MKTYFVLCITTQFFILCFGDPRKLNKINVTNVQCLCPSNACKITICTAYQLKNGPLFLDVEYKITRPPTEKIVLYYALHVNPLRISNTYLTMTRNRFDLCELLDGKVTERIFTAGANYIAKVSNLLELCPVVKPQIYYVKGNYSEEFLIYDTPTSKYKFDVILRTSSEIMAAFKLIIDVTKF